MKQGRQELKGRKVVSLGIVKPRKLQGWRINKTDALQVESYLRSRT